ncbi:MAG: hypothetical protein NT062_29500 [Proteobacteria bacterium]|nr:hypothetical protein [Pseudomonadota bacterium]
MGVGKAVVVVGVTANVTPGMPEAIRDALRSSAFDAFVAAVRRPSASIVIACTNVRSTAPAIADNWVGPTEASRAAWMASIGPKP